MFTTKIRTTVIVLVASVGVAGASLVPAVAASAETSTTLCVPEAAGKPVVTPNIKGECVTKYKAAKLPGPGGLATLNKILPYETFVEKGVGGKPTIQISGANLQILNGAGSTASVNGAGNLIIGYDENPGSHAQTGSHDLILGDEQTFTSFAGLVAGRFNTISGEYSSVSGGAGNAASAIYASVSGGATNTASGVAASVTAGEENTASGKKASVSGGKQNNASNLYASVSGGLSNLAGVNLGATIGGGFSNEATGEDSSISGGDENKATGIFSSINGGRSNGATGPFTAVLGEKEGTAWREYEAIL
jgi:hypothetical protein